MRFIRSFFNLRTIYSKQTPTRIVIMSAYAALLGTGITSYGFYNKLAPPHTFILLYVVAAYFILRSIIRTLLVDSLLKEYSDAQQAVQPEELRSSSVQAELDSMDGLKFIKAFTNARLFLANFDFYRYTKYGDYLAKQAYYVVLEVQLGRTLPHILFDSKSAKKRQFKNMYLQAQRISVQGPFDDVFDTYVPQTYVIDSLSFVTPEVMETLLEARSYDIEILNDKLLLYAPLISLAETEAFAIRGRAIAERLNRTIDTYRDDRLTGQERKTQVTYFARSLLRSPFKNMVQASLFGIATAILLYAGLAAHPENRDDILFNVYSLFVYLLLLINIYKAVEIQRANKRALEGYRILYQTDRGKPIKTTIV